MPLTNAIETKRKKILDGRPYFERFVLKPECQNVGTITDADDLPVTNAQVAVTELCTKRIRFPFLEMDSSFLFSETEHFERVNQDGSFQLGGLPRNRLVTITVRVPDFEETGFGDTYVVPSNRYPGEDKAKADKWFKHLKWKLGTDHANVRIKSPQSISKFVPRKVTPQKPPQVMREARIRIIDKVTRTGVAGIGVSVTGHFRVNDQFRPQSIPNTVSDKNGLAVLKISTAKSAIYAYGRRFGIS